MPTADRIKRKRKTENELQAQKCKKLFQFFNRSESPISSCLRTSECLDEETSDLPTSCTSTLLSQPCASPISSISAESTDSSASSSLPESCILTATSACPSPIVCISSPSRQPRIESLKPNPSSPASKERIRNNSGHGTAFNPKWQENRPWLENCKEYGSDGFSYDSMYCSLCRKWDTKGRNNSKVWNKIGCVSTRLDVVVNHEQSEMHRDAVFKEMAQDQGVDTAFENMSKKEIEALTDAQKVLYFLIKHHLPYKTLFEPLMDLCIDLGATNLQYLPKAKNASYKSPASATEFLECQAEVVEATVHDALKRSQSYGVMVDEYTDVSSRKHLAMVCRYIDNGASRLAFLQDVQLPNGEAETIYSAMKGHLAESAIPLDKMTSFASDGPSVMLGKKNGVVALLKRDNPSVINIHCMNHRLQLAISKAFHSVTMIDNTDEMLTGLFKYYHYSTVRSESLNAIQTLLRETRDLELENNITMKKAVHTRWLSHENAVQTVRKLYAAILTDLENAVASGRDKTTRENKGIPASSLLKMMRTYEKLYFIHLLCDVCTSLASLTKTFEREDVDLSIIEPRVTATLSALRKMKERDAPYTNRVTTVAQSLNIIATENTVHAIYKARDTFIDNLTQNIEDRLANTEIVNYLSMLDLSHVNPGEATFHGDAAISYLAAHFNMDEDITLHQWNDLKEFFKDQLNLCTPKYLLETLTKAKPTVGDMFPNIVQLLSVAESLIISTSAVERVFSRVKLTVTTHRNRLAVKTVSKLLTVGLNTDSVDDLDLDRVVRLYLAKKNRRLVPSSASSYT